MTNWIVVDLCGPLCTYILPKCVGIHTHTFTPWLMDGHISRYWAGWLAGWLYTVLSNDWNGKTSECRIQIWSDFNVSLELLILAERNQISWLLDWIADWLTGWLMDRLDCWLYFLHSIHTIAIMSSFVDSSVLRNLCKIMENSWEIP